MSKRAGQLEQAVWQYIHAEGMLKGEQTVGVAVSGGADSMALLVCLGALAPRHGFRVHALHYEHGIRGEESDRDCRFVEEWCAERGVPLLVGHGDVPRKALEEKTGIEAAARSARHAFFSDAVARGPVDLVATAHHQDDNAETVLLHAFRGSGLDGICGIAPKRGFLIRPFLCVSRREILGYLEDLGVPWVEDSTNQDESYDRNYVRRTLLPQIERDLAPGATRALCRLAAASSLDAQYLAEAADEALGACLLSRTADSVRLDAGAVAALHPAMGARTIRAALAAMGRRVDVEAVHIADILDGARREKTGKVCQIGDGVCARMEYGQLVLERDIPETEPVQFEEAFAVPAIIPLPSGELETRLVEGRSDDTLAGLREYADLDKIPQGAVMRTRRPGDRIRPLGAPGSRKLKEYLIDRKVPLAERGLLPLLASGSDILWVVGHVLSQDVRVDDRTRRVCRMTYVPRC